MKKLNLLLLALGLALLSSASLVAATSTWDGDTDTLFSTALNWDAAPGTGDALVFPSAASYTVDFTGVNPNNGPITFNASSDYLLTPPGQTLTLNGDITQSGSGAVTSDISLNLGGATRSFGGAGTGLARFNGAISGTTAGLNITGGSYALAAVNGFDGGVTASGGTVKIVKAGFGDLDYQVNFDPAGSGAVTLNGGRIELVCDDPLGTIANRRITTFGAVGGTLVYGNFNQQISGNTMNQNVVNGPATIVAYPARLGTTDPTGSSANDNAAGTCQLQELQGSGQITLVLRNGAAGRFQIQTAAFPGSIVIDGQPGGDVSADQSPSSPNQGTNIVYMALNNIANGNLYQVNGGIFFTNYCQLWFTHSNQRTLDSDVTVMPNSGFAVQGRPQAGSDRPFIFGNSSSKKITIQDTGLAQMDLQVSTWVNPFRSVRMNSSTFIEAGGTLRFTRTYDPGSAPVRNIEVNSAITAKGTAAKDSVMDLLLDNGTGTDDGVTFNSGANLVVNGTGTGGLRVQAKSAAALQNLLATARLNALTGSGGALTLALTNNDSFTITDGPSSASLVALGVDSQGGSSPTYVLGTASTLANFAGLVLKGGTVSLPAASSVTLGTLDVAGNGTLQMGSSGTLHFAASSGVAWTAGKTLTISGWVGGAYGGGADQIYVGASAGGLTASQLAQIKWINPFGSGDVTGAFQLPSGEIVPATGQSFMTSPGGGGATDFQVSVTGVAGKTYVVDRTLSLAPTIIWTPVKTNTGSFLFSDPGSAGASERFYRVRHQ